MEVIPILVVSSLFANAVQSIDRNEKLGKCIPAFQVPHIHQMQQNEGIWFPQYRTSGPKNDKYKCHTIYEKVYYNDPATIDSESYYTVNGKPLKDPYAQSYRQDEKDVLVEEEYENQANAFKVFSYTIAITDDYRVRYVCTDHPKSMPSAPLVYIETRKSTPSIEEMKPAFHDIRKAGLKLTLERIDQKNCVRPLGYDGYNTSWERHEHDKDHRGAGQ